MTTPTPIEIKLLQREKKLTVHFDNDEIFTFNCEFLRVNSPSAEVQGHGGVGGQIPTGKQDVNIIAIDPVGQYAVKLIFDDGHQSGLFTWAYLYDLGKKATAINKDLKK